MADPTKICNPCGETKTLDRFFSHLTTSDGVRTYCRDCATVMMQKYRKNNPDRVLAGRLKRRYNLSLESYSRLLSKQNNSCAICFKQFGMARPYFPCVDHNHVTLEVRGLLCIDCNLLLGKVNDDIKILENAIIYLKENTNE